MPNYVPCRVKDDGGQVHLYAAAEAERALCGEPVAESSRSAEGGTPCPACAQRLLAHIFRAGGEQGISSVEVTIQH